MGVPHRPQHVLVSESRAREFQRDATVADEQHTHAARSTFVCETLPQRCDTLGISQQCYMVCAAFHGKRLFRSCSRVHADRIETQRVIASIDEEQFSVHIDAWHPALYESESLIHVACISLHDIEDFPLAILRSRAASFRRS